MPIYHKLGQIPKKRHVAFRKDGEGIYYEELMGNMGFSGISSLLYHIHRPTTVTRVEKIRDDKWEVDPDPTLRMRHLKTAGLKAGGSATFDRTPLLFNDDVAISFTRPDKTDDFFYRNGQGDEVLYVSDGGGVLESVFGDLEYGQGDYLVIPRGILYRLRPTAGIDNRILVVETRGYIRTPKRYRNPHGQLLEHSPFCERDFRLPERLNTTDQFGEFKVVVKQHSALHEYTVDHHPFDVVGWDGYYFPWAFNIADFEPIVGRIHQPPPVHQTFESEGVVICSFVPRLYDFHPDAIPAPYHHSNVMSDEVLFYVSKEFMSRKNIEYGSITLHPDGLPHGPHPGKTEESIGKTETNELAVMIDTFRPLHVAKAATAVEDKDYYRSWLA